MAEITKRGRKVPPQARRKALAPGKAAAPRKTSEALLKHNPSPTETEIRYWLAGNLCRCTGYDKIVKAVVEAAADMKRSA